MNNRFYQNYMAPGHDDNFNVITNFAEIWLGLIRC